jgi:hypothetical protein
LSLTLLLLLLLLPDSLPHLACFAGVDPVIAADTAAVADTAAAATNSPGLFRWR